MAESVAAARQEVANSRLAAEAELDEIADAARAAVDIPSKLRREPLKYGGLGAGAVFLAIGGPKRLFKAVEKRAFPKRHVRSLTPKEVERSIEHLPEEDRAEVRAHLDRDFAAYLRREHPKHEPNARRSLWGTYDTAMAIIGAAAARELARRFFAPPGDRRVQPRKGPPAGEDGLGL
ncbi:MAG TPA: hypothetical protein VNT28_05990 [Candidatus Limnocylindrales bacterium]|jgi:hypothetical protein|nr:hypothetical protein [Candidatus Limnocylindrales bacterium]